MLRIAVPVLVAAAALHGGQPPVDLHGLAVVAGKPTADAVIWLDAPNAPPAATPARTAPAITLDQRNMTFVPHVLVVRVGTIVKFPNDDRVFHDVFSFHDGKKFDLGLYPVGEVKYVKFDTPGLSRIFCNIHAHMAAYVLAVDTPYYALSDRTGHYTIRGVQPDTYTYHAWRPGGEILNDTITVASGAQLQVVWQ